MNWVTIVWSMGASTCLTLAAIYLLVWLKAPATRAHLLFAVTAAATSVFAFFELRMLTAQTPQALDAALRWGQVPLSVMVVSLIWFVSLYLQAGRRWLAWTICGIRLIYVMPNFIGGGNSTLLQISRLEQMQLFGETLTLVRGTTNPLFLLGNLSVILSVCFVLDAAITTWRRGDRRRALVIGGGSAFILTAGMIMAGLVLWAGVRAPIAISLSAQVLIAVMGLELSRDVIRASELAHALRESEARESAILRAVPDLMFLQTADGVFLDYHAPHPSQLFLPPEQFLGRNMREVLPQAVLRDLEPAFRRVAQSAEPILVEYALAVPDGHQMFEARLVPGANGRILTLVRDVTETRRAQVALRESEAVLQASHLQIQKLAAHLIESQEVERARIARELHDDLSQQLAALSIALSGLKRRVGAVADASELQAEIAALQQRAVALAGNVRHLSHDLHPSMLAHGGLVATLGSHCSELARTQSIMVTFTSEGEFDAIAPAAALCLYRVAQEALRNVVAHAEASHAHVRLVRASNDAELTISDDGKGFTLGPTMNGRGLGLVSINERAKLSGGSVSLVTELHRGTRVTVKVPVTETPLSAAAH